MILLPVLVFFLVNILIILYQKKSKSLKNFPKGPTNLPFIGSILSVGFDLKAAFLRWRNIGSIVGFHLGEQPCIVINDFDILNEAFKDDRFSGKPKNLQDAFHALFQKDENETLTGGGGIVFSEGDAWKEQRRFAMKTLKDFGAGKSSLQHVISEEVLKLVEEFKNETGKPIRLKNRTNGAVSNTLWQILNGEKSDLNDPQMMRAFISVSTFLEDNNLAGPIFLFPWLRNFPIIKSLFEKARSSSLEMRKVTSKAIQSHIESYDGETERDFIDCYLKKMNETKDEKSSFYKGNGEGNIQRTVMDLFGAGSETTSSAITFAINYLIRYPEIQQRVHDEIDNVIGSGQATLEDKPRMSYTDAFIHEVLRFSCISYTFPHSTTEDVEFHGYHLPAGTTVYPNISWIMNDPKHWEAPEQFNPERFIDSESGKLRITERFIPFLIGKRYCFGQQLAHHQLFLFLVGLLQSFTFTTPLASPSMVNIEPIVGFTHQCPDYQVILSNRV